MCDKREFGKHLRVFWEVICVKHSYNQHEKMLCLKSK